MIIYLDTSSLVKLYVEEVHSTAVREWVEDAELVSTCRIAYPETLSALTRRFRGGDFSEQNYDRLIKGFSEDWLNFVVLDFDEIEAGSLVKKYGLKGFDAVHLSSAKTLLRDKELLLNFSCFDEKLNKAAASEGLEVLMPD
ncbi:MAG TPA: type II toxin-antitoxin system VapC family toxin [Thermodesulfobacteriota bacterium]|nr:type II toxin-antitoxin system VapC family toxin [Thermodesulfobacteriota bacterium]